MSWCRRICFNAFYLKWAIEGVCTDLIKKSIPNSGSIERKAIIKLFDRLLSRLKKVWYHKEITNTLTPHGTILTTIKTGTEQNTWGKNQHEETYKQVWLFETLSDVQQADYSTGRVFTSVCLDFSCIILNTL